MLQHISVVIKSHHRKSKGKVHRRTGNEGPGGKCRYISTLSLTSALDRGGWTTPCPSHFTPGRGQVSIVQGAGWTSGPAWTSMENLAPTGVRSPDRPAHSKSLYRLSYPSSGFIKILTEQVLTYNVKFYHVVYKHCFCKYCYNH
jgi:hypothetical protein